MKGKLTKREQDNIRRRPHTQSHTRRDGKANAVWERVGGQKDGTLSQSLVVKAISPL